MARRKRTGLISMGNTHRDFAHSYQTVWTYPGWSPTRFNGLTMEELKNRYPNNPSGKLVGQRINALMEPLLPKIIPGEKLTYKQIEMLLGNGWKYVATKTSDGRNFIYNHPEFVRAHPEYRWDGNNRLFVNVNTNQVIPYRKGLEVARGRVLPNARWNLVFKGYAMEQSPKVFGEEVEGDPGGKIWVDGMYAPGILFTYVRGSIPENTVRDARVYIDAARAVLFIIEIQFVLMEYTG